LLGLSHLKPLAPSTEAILWKESYKFVFNSFAFVNAIDRCVTC
jgi:hypothetical protein